jgi:hypothetical protein
MASPFRVFRKYQKTLLAVAGVVLMFVFVVGDSLFSYFGGGRNARAGDDRDAKATAVHWDGGKLSNRELNELVMRRRILNNFLKNVEIAGMRPSAEAGVDPPELRVQRLIAPETQIETSVVRTKLFADAARESGMKISDDTLLQYLSELGRRNVSPDQMRDMLKNLSIGGGRLSTDYVLEALRQEMLAHNYHISHEFALLTVTPEQRWKDWMRVNDRVVVEAAAVPAEMYLADVKEPTDAELTAFFEKYKDREAMPDFYGNTEMPSATPGFRIPRKIDLQFIQADYDEFLAKAEAKITDEEVAKYYEDHKDLFTKLNASLTEDKDSKKETPKTDAPPTKTDAKDGATSAKPADAEKKPAEPADKKTEVPEKKEAPPAAKNEKTDAKSSDDKKSSSHPNPTKSVFRLAAFAQDAEKKDAKADKSAEKSSETPAAKSDAVETKPAPPADKPAASPPASTPPAATPAAPPDASKAAPATQATPAPKKPVEYQPLSEVKDEIRKRLAEGKVADELAKLTSGIQDGLDSDYNKWRYSDSQMSDAEKKEMPAPPKPLTDFASIAQKNGLKSGTTGPKSLLELRSLPVGNSTAIDANRTLLSMLFQGHDVEMYQPVKTIDIDKNRYIVMKIGDTPGREPTLADVRDEVVKAWKKQQAADLAKKHADEFAKKAEEAKTPLANFFADDKSVKVVRTDPFSELTGGEAAFVGGQVQQQPYRFSQPSEIVAAGPDFLRGVFNLKDGQVGVLLNNDHSIAYVVRVVEHQPALPELRNAYMAEAYSWNGENLMNQLHRQEIASNLEQDIEVSNNLKWDRAADQNKNEKGDEG